MIMLMILGGVDMAQNQNDELLKLMGEKEEVKEREKPSGGGEPPTLPTHKKTTTMDLRDLQDEFVTWINKLDLEQFHGNRKAVVARIQNYKRPALMDGTLALLSKFLKENKMRIVK